MSEDTKTEPCPKCREQITTHGAGRAAHIRQCKGKVENNAPTKVIQIDPLGAQTGGGPKVAPSGNSSLEQEIAYAEEKTGRQVAEIERVRAEAPDAIVSFAASPDEFVVTEKRLRAEGKIPEDHVLYWGDVLEHKANIHKYIPVNDDGKQPRIGENEAFHRHKSLYQAEIQSSEEQSKAMFDAEYHIGGVAKGKEAAKLKPETEKLLK